MPEYLSADQYKVADFNPDGRLNVFRSGTDSKCLLVFVHGLGGSGYGTWGDFPLHILRAGHDVAIADYLSFYRRWGHLKTPTPESTATILCQELERLPAQYEHIVLVAHSMGGIVAEFAATEYFDKLSRRVRRDFMPLAGMVVIACPRRGAYGWTTWAADFQFLSRQNQMFEKVKAFGSRHLDFTCTGSPNVARWSFPIFGLSAASDRWVKTVDSSLAVPEDQHETVGGTHKSVVKPTDAQHKSVRFVLEKLHEIVEMRISISHRTGGDPTFSPGVLVTEMLDESDPYWLTAYRAAMDEVAATSQISICDIHYMASDCQPELSVRVLESDLITDDPQRAHGNLKKDHARATSHHRARLGIVPHGASHAAAEASVKRFFLGTARTPWVRGCPDSQTLQEVITEWMNGLAGFHRQASSPDLRRANSLNEALGHSTEPGLRPRLDGGDEH